MKAFLIFVIALALVGGGFYWFQNYNRTGGVASDEVGVTEEDEASTGQTITARGVVTGVDRDAIAYDGPAYVVIDTDDGKRITVAVPSMGLGLCTAREEILDVYALAVGVEVEVFGESDGEGHVVPCRAPDHYFRIIVD